MCRYLLLLLLSILTLQVILPSSFPTLKIPAVGFGCAGLGLNEEEIVSYAIKKGFRLFDTAQATEWYKEDAVGNAIAKSGIPRSDFFITTKLHPKNFQFDKALQSVERSLLKLRTDYIDLLILHTSSCLSWSGDCRGDIHGGGSFLDAWRALEELYNQKKVRAIGVSNFRLEELEILSREGKFPIQNVQNFFDPFHQDFDVRLWCKEKGVTYTSYSTLGTQRGHPNPVLTSPTILSIAAKHNSTPVLVTLSFALQEGVLIIPRSSNPHHIDELATLLSPSFKPFLTQEEMEQMRSLDLDGRGSNGVDEL